MSSRTFWLSFAAVAAACSSSPTTSRTMAPTAAEASFHAETPAQGAIDRLLAGNRRFTSGHLQNEGRDAARTTTSDRLVAP